MRNPPARGDTYRVELDPIRGQEQRGKRSVFVLSPAEFNRRGLTIVLPISQGVTLARSAGFTVTLMGAGLLTQGVVICDQPRTLDFAARGATFVERAPDFVIEEVLTRIAPLVT